MSLLISTQGRIGRKPFWLGFLILILTSALIGFGLAALSLTGSGIGALLAAVLGLVLLYPAAALTVKRLRDRGRRNLWAWMMVYLVPGQLVNLGQALGVGFEEVRFGDIVTTSPNALGATLLAVSFATFASAVVDLGILKGQTEAALDQ